MSRAQRHSQATTVDLFGAVLGTGRSGAGEDRAGNEAALCLFLNGITGRGGSLTVTQPALDITLLMDEHEELVAVRWNSNPELGTRGFIVWIRANHPQQETLLSLAQEETLHPEVHDEPVQAFIHKLAVNTHVRQALIDGRVATQDDLMEHLAGRLSPRQHKEIMALNANGTMTIRHLAQVLFDRDNLLAFEEDNAEDIMVGLAGLGLVEQHSPGMYNLTADGMCAAKHIKAER